MDSVTEVTSQGWFSRIKDAIFGVLFGILFFFGSMVLLWWNEGRAVQTAQSLAEGRGAVVEAEAETVDPSLDKKLVHLTGKATSDETLRDPQFQVETDQLGLTRHAEMYQWVEETEKETRKKVGGGKETITTYRYDTEWDDSYNDSSRFKESAGHHNPSMEFRGSSWEVGTVHVGAHTLSSSLQDQLSGSQGLPFTEEQKMALPGRLAERAVLQGNYLYIGQQGPPNPSSPQVGDMRVRFTVIPEGPVSLIAQQIGDSFQAYQTKAGDKLAMLSMGTKSADEMFTAAETTNTIMTWVLRFVGWFVMFLGIYMVFRPLEVLGDVIPFVGSMIGFGLSLFAGVISAFLSLLVIALAWFAYRPLLSIALLAVGVGLVVAGRSMAKGSAGAAASGGGAPPPVPPEGGGGPPPIPEE